MEGFTLFEKTIGRTQLEESPFRKTIEGVRANVVFGKLSKDCAGIGICKVTVNASSIAVEKQCRQSAAIIRKNRYGQIEFYFDPETICQPGKRKFFKREFFHVGESFYLPGEISGWLGLKNPIIQAGDYPMKKTKDYILVVFNTD